MKKRFYILIILFAFFIMPQLISASTVDMIKMDINILENGDAEVKEYWNAHPTHGTEFYKPYFNLGNSKITNFVVKEENILYENIQNWNSNKSIAEKKYKSGISYKSNGLELVWGIGSYEKHTYELNYTITKFVKGYNDAQLIYFTLLNSGMSPLPKEVDINITTAKTFPDETLIWGYGWNNGKADLENGKLKFNTLNKLKHHEYITILVKLPKDYFDTQEFISEDFSTVFYRAEEGVQLPETIDDDRFTIFDFIGIVVPFFFFIVFLLSIAKQKQGEITLLNKKVPKKRDLNYFRDIPCDKNLYLAYWLGQSYSFIDKKEDLLGAILLKWIQSDHINIVTEKIGVLKKEKNAIDFTKPFNCEYEFEESLKNILIEAAGKNLILEEKEFSKWAETNYTVINKWFKDVYADYTNKLLKNNLLKAYIAKGKKDTYTASERLNQEATNLLGLKKYLEEFSSIDEKRSFEVKLWNEYLVFAQVLGIADKVAKEFEKVYPNYIEDMNMSYTMNDLHIINHMSRNAMHSARAAHSAHIQRMHSGGGGSSFGGGGGGSFGGGGSGGGIR